MNIARRLHIQGHVNSGRIPPTYKGPLRWAFFSFLFNEDATQNHVAQSGHRDNLQ